MQNGNSSSRRTRHSIDTVNNGSKFAFTNKYRGINLWRSSSLINLVSYGRKNNSIYESTVIENNDTDGTSILSKDGERVKVKGGWNTVINIVLVEAKGLPAHPNDGTSHSLHCKIRLGSQTLKSKSVHNTPHPEWRERFKLHLYKDHLLRISIWDKGKQKNFMGSCVLDLSNMEKERTHEIWQNLDDGFGSVHLSVTMCTIRSTDFATSNDADCIPDDIQEKYAIFNFEEDWKVVGKVLVKIICAKGLNGTNAYCALELDNERVETPTVRGSEPEWNKTYFFNVYDVTSTLDLKVYDKSLLIAIGNDTLGKVSIPLLRIRNGETCWYALKDKSKRHIAKGNCPRVQMEMTIVWNPMKAALKLFQPKEVKHIKKPTKFDIGLVYQNVEFVRDVFDFLIELNESFKRLFEWDNREMSFIALSGWLLFWYCFEIWMVPLLCLIPFIYFWMSNMTHKKKSFLRDYGSREESEQYDITTGQSLRNLSLRVQGLPEMTLSITNAVEFIASFAEKMYNLASFKVPYLSYLTIVLIIITSFVLYLIPFKYLFMALGIYKFTRKYLNPERVLNNDLMDFISRIPDNEVLKDWEELSVPEPIQLRIPSKAA